MVIVTNIGNFPERWRAAGGETGESVIARRAEEYLERRQPETVWLVNCDPGLSFRLAAARLRPGARPPLICVDLVLRRPHTAAEKLALPLKRVLLGRVSHFIHYFTDLRGYQEVYGIGPERSSFIPFKANLRYRHAAEADAEGRYILCLGRSLRDFDTFFAAVEQLPYPAAIARPDVEKLRAHGARFTRSLDQLPANVELLDDDGSDAAMLRILEGARVVVLPTVRSGMVASISVALNAMLLGKCVVGSEGPGMSDIFPGMALTAPPEDPAALAGVIRRAWEDDELRTRTAAAGHAYALSVGGEPELYQRMIDRVVSWYRA